MYCAGGEEEAYMNTFSTIYQYEESGNGNWRNVSNLIYPRSKHAVSVIMDQKLLEHCTSTVSSAARHRLLQKNILFIISLLLTR